MMEEGWRPLFRDESASAEAEPTEAALRQALNAEAGREDR